MELLKAVFNVYLWTVVLTLICGGLANLRLFKYRKDIDMFMELYFSVGIACIPVMNVFCSVSYLQIFFAKKREVKILSKELDKLNKKYK